ncbi:dinitrogenase iron-molybdenum cofactor family protein [Clostridium sporogenes]|nr:dinitrogenase iron-molybdenum cofactor family protein [Clostridium sporogenes]
MLLLQVEWEKQHKIYLMNNIEVVVGAQGFSDDIAQEYIQGELKSTGSVCREHEHEGHCNE